MKYAVTFLLICVLAGNKLTSQGVDLQNINFSSVRKNSIYFELLGNGAVYSFNYDRIVPLKQELALVVRIGGNEYHGISNNRLSWNLIGAAGILVGSRYSFFETSLGYTHFLREQDRLIILTGGYRFQGRKGLVFRATPMFIINTETGDTFGNSLWFGLSLGYSF